MVFLTTGLIMFTMTSAACPWDLGPEDDTTILLMSI